ncbi:MAG: hypothetical protein ACI9J3_003436 [Parvicellaceae bacterium]|jgi:hypothetical protein
MRKVFVAIGALLILSSATSFAQNDCFQFVRICDNAKKEGYFYNGQSKSGAFVTGDTTEVTMIAYKGMDYRVSACADEEAMPGPVQIRIVERAKKARWKDVQISEKVEKKDAEGMTIYGEDGNPEMQTITRTEKKRVYEMKETVRYDSKKDGGDFSFMSDRTRKLHIEVIVPGAGGGDGLASEEGVMVACVGLLVEHRKGIRLGFGQ